MVVLLIISLLLLIVCLVVYTLKMKTQNLTEYNQVEDLNRRIDELDDDNITTSSQGTGKIFVPDVVDPDESTLKSTQKEECKEYTVGPKQKIEKTVIGKESKTEVFENTEIERIEDEEDEGPIKENEGLISKILNNKDEE